MYEATEVAKFLLEVEGADLDYEREVATEDRAQTAMEAVHEAGLELRYDRCPHCDEQFGAEHA